jgi:hypothetical protein
LLMHSMQIAHPPHLRLLIVVLSLSNSIPCHITLAMDAAAAALQL